MQTTCKSVYNNSAMSLQCIDAKDARDNYVKPENRDQIHLKRNIAP